MTSFHPAARLLAALVPLAWSMPAPALPTLAVSAPADAALMHEGQTRVAHANDALAAGDAVTAAGSGGTTLQLDRYGALELGPAATLSVLRLPFSSYASDLATALKLDGGYLRIVWKYPALSAPWP
ncbi:MAG TPA: hypothetical protein VHE37_11000, partial [Nevskiaceae bacterium]|nr:hypothetical protein [Nevskiaceae bacterium]